jgi:serine/threonine-protein kinase Chk2
LLYLHDRPEPLVHQGINPRNILVQYHDPGNNHKFLQIKLSDFGSSKTGGLRSFAGSETYLPPEALENGAPRRHTPAADIWSLGLVILRLAYGLPSPGRGSDSQWCRKVVQEVKTRDSDDLIDILQHMLVIDPSGRHSAIACLQAVSQLLDASRTRSATPTPVASAAKGKAREILPHQVCFAYRLKPPCKPCH